MSFFFKRNKEEISARENLPHYVQSGSLSGDVIDHLLLLMNSVFVPMSMADHAWPDNVRKEFTAQVRSAAESPGRSTWVHRGGARKLSGPRNHRLIETRFQGCLSNTRTLCAESTMQFAWVQRPFITLPGVALPCERLVLGQGDYNQRKLGKPQILCFAKLGSS